MARKDPRDRSTYQKERREKRRQAGLCLTCGKVPPREGKTSCADCQARSSRNHVAWWRRQPPGTKRWHHTRYRDKLRQEVLDAYGGKCACCGEAEPRFLTIDHPNKDGAKHREELIGTKKQASGAFYTKLRQLGFPPGLRVLCWNCNCASYVHGVCPHELARAQAG